MEHGNCGENLTWTLDNGTLTISGQCEMENYEPDYDYSDGEGGYYGEEGDSHWWHYHRAIKRIIIRDGVVFIGEGAFRDCVSLKEVTIPNSVEFKYTGYDYDIFHGCSSPKKIYYPAGRDFEEYLSEGNNAQLIPYEKLWWKVEGKTLTVGGVSEIKAYSYEETPWRDSLNEIQRIIIEEGVEKISARAFEECRRLELLTIPASVKTIGDMAFSFCYCGNRLANGGKNVYWTLEDGVLNLKKNPTVRGDADFSTGAVTWLAVEKNITGIKLEAGVVPKEKFFEWLGRRSNAMQIAFG